MNTRPVEKWPGLARLFHWGSVILLIVTWMMIQLHGDSATGSSYMSLHQAFGISLLFWMLARIINRFFTQPPKQIPMQAWQHGIAHLTHFALYLTLVAMPVAGILMAWYGGHSVNFFGLFELSPMVEIDRSQARFFNNLHTDTIWPALIVFTVLHVVGALYHQFILKDNLIARMK